MGQLVVSFVTMWLDYCNYIFASLPKSTLEPVQGVQNAAIRLFFNLCGRDHVTASLIQFHWLPMLWRIQFKSCVLMHSVHYGRAPRYIADLVQLVSVRSNRPSLRSAQSKTKPRLRTRFGERAFSYADPDSWNSLPPQLGGIPEIRLFEAHLKTHFLNQAFFRLLILRVIFLSHHYLSLQTLLYFISLFISL